MKKVFAIITLVLFVSGFSASAQMMGQNNNQNMQRGMMMQGRMMQGMMTNGMCPMCGQMMGEDMPMQRCGMMINRLPYMQQQLSLNDKQVDELMDYQREFKKQQIDYTSEWRKKQMAMNKLMNNNASPNKVKKQIEACSEIRADMSIAAYETVNEMKSVLTSDQKETLKNLMQRGMMNQGNMMNQRNMMSPNDMMNQGGMMQNQNNQ